MREITFAYIGLTLLAGMISFLCYTSNDAGDKEVSKKAWKLFKLMSCIGLLLWAFRPCEQARKHKKHEWIA